MESDADSAESAAMTQFEVGQIKAHMEHDLGPSAISKRVFKPYSTDTWTPTRISLVMDKIKKNKNWRGKRKPGSGAPKKTTKHFDNKVKNLVLKKRGQRKVTVAFIKKVIPEAREFGKDLIADRLAKAGLIWLRRRKKTIVPGQKHKDARLLWAAFVKTLHLVTLARWAYSDGMCYYLERTEECAGAVSHPPNHRPQGGALLVLHLLICAFKVVAHTVAVRPPRQSDQMQSFHKRCP